MREQVLRQACSLFLPRDPGRRGLDKFHKEYIDSEKYTDKNLYQLFLKVMGRSLEDVESRALREHYDVYYSRLKDVGCG